MITLITIWQLNFKNIKQILTWPLYIVYKEQFKNMNNIVSSLLLQMQILHDDILNYKQLCWGENHLHLMQTTITDWRYPLVFLQEEWKFKH